MAQLSCETDESAGVSELLVTFRGVEDLPPDAPENGLSPKWTSVETVRLLAVDSSGVEHTLFPTEDLEELEIRVVGRPQVVFAIPLLEKTASLSLSRLELELNPVGKGGLVDGEDIEIELVESEFSADGPWQVKEGEDLEWSFSLNWKNTYSTADEEAEETEATLVPAEWTQEVLVVEE